MLPQGYLDKYTLASYTSEVPIFDSFFSTEKMLVIRVALGVLHSFPAFPRPFFAPAMHDEDHGDEDVDDTTININIIQNHQ